MGKDNFYKNSLLLTVSNLATGVLRFMFSIVLSKKLGAEGLGLFGLIMPVYDLFCTLICGGMVTAMSKESSTYYSKGDIGNLNKSVHIAFAFDVIWSISIAALVFFISPFISSNIIKDSRTLYSLWVICPALVFIGLSSIFKGYFYGISNIKVPAIIDIVEKFIRMGVIVALVNVLPSTDVTYTVTATYIAFTAGELVSFLLLFIFYKRDKKKLYTKPVRTEGRVQLLFNLLAVALPLSINGFLTTGISTVSTLLVPRRLVSAGLEYGHALGLIGKFSGMALTIVFFPMIVIMSISILLIPDISKSLATSDYYGMEKRIKEVLRISFLLGMCTLLICVSIPTSLGEMFFSRNDLGEFIKMAAVAAPFAYLSASTYGILNGLGKQKVVLKNSIITSIEQLILFYVLLGIPSINIYGYGIGFIITSITTIILNMIEIKKSCHIEISPGEIVMELTLSVLLYLILNIMNNLIPSSIFAIKNIAIITVGFSMFFFSVILINKTETE